MAIIEFGTGQRVEFNGTPTQADVEEVARQLGIGGQPFVQPTQQGISEKISSGLDVVFGGKKLGEAIGTKIAEMRATPEERAFIQKGPSTGEVIGSALQSASLFVPVGRVAGGLTTGARALGISKGASAIGKIGAGALTGELIGTASGLESGQTLSEAIKPGVEEAIGTAIPVAGVAKNVAVRFGKNQGPRVINSLIKPLLKDFSYGKNPGRAVAEEGIIANNFDELINGITTRRQEIGQEIGSIGQQLSTSKNINVFQSLNPINDAMRVAASQNNPTLLSRLSNAKQAITEILEPAIDDTGNITIRSAGQRKLNNLDFSETRDILREIGDMTQFTGNPSDDKLVNSALKQVYGSIKEETLKEAQKLNPNLAKRFEQLTEKYADLSSARTAAIYRDKLAERQNLIGLPAQALGIGSALITAVATGGASIPVVLAGAGGLMVDKLAASPAFKTRLAAILSKKTTQEASGLFQKIPILKKIFPEGSSLTPGDRLLSGK